MPQTGKTVRLIKDWMQWQGSKPRYRFTASVKPLPRDGEEKVPGGRVKLANGKWGFLYEHPEHRYFRD